MDIMNLTALEIGAKIKAGELSSVEAVQASLDAIAAKEPACKSFTSVQAELALEQAKLVQEKIRKGELSSPLAGVPVGIKDNMSTKGRLTTCSSRMLENYVPAFDATAVERLEAAGAVIVGKLNMDEFAMGASTETSYFKKTANPWDTSRVPGGSSGGSAASVAAREVPFSLGSDTGGSIRQPSAYCGVTGLKPTYGSVSRWGLIAFASSLDQIGPIAKDAADCAAVLETISGRDAHDSTCVNRDPFDFSGSIHQDIRGMKIGVPNEFFGTGVDPDVRSRVLEAAETLKAMGASVEYFDMPITSYAIPAYYIICCAEASSNLSRYDGVKYGFRGEGYEGLTDLYLKSRSQGFGMEVKRRIMLGAFVLSSGYYDAYYNKALKVKHLIKSAFDEAFEKYDIILGPTSPTTAFKFGENIDDPLKMYLLDVYTAPVNLAGLPGISLPCGLDSKGLPVGLQLIGRPFGEADILRAACAFQRETDFHKARPAEF